MIIACDVTLTIRMLSAIDFNNQFSPQACKIDDVWSDRHRL